MCNSESVWILTSDTWLISSRVQESWRVYTVLAEKIHTHGKNVQVYDIFCISVVKQLNFDEVMSQSSPTNCTVYCGGIINGLTGIVYVLSVCLLSVHILSVSSIVSSSIVSLSIFNSCIAWLFWFHLLRRKSPFICCQNLFPSVKSKINALETLWHSNKW